MANLDSFFKVWHRTAAGDHEKWTSPPPVAQSAGDAVRIAEELLATVKYVSEAPQIKAKTPRTRRAAFERDVLLKAGKVTSLGRSMLSSSLNALRHYRAVGLLDRGFATWKKAVAEAAEVSLHDVWDGVLKLEGVRDVLSENGLSERVLERMGRTLAEHDQIQSINTEGKLRSRAKHSEREFTYADPAVPKQDRSLGDLFTKNRFDTIASHFDAPGRIAVDVMLSEQKTESVTNPDVDLLDGSLLSGVLTMRELDRMVCELEETGVAEHEGELAGWLIAVITLLSVALGLFAAGMILDSVCVDTGEESYCTAAQVLLLLAILSMAAAFFITGFAGVEFGVTVLGIIAAGSGFIGSWGGLIWFSFLSHGELD